MQEARYVRLSYLSLTFLQTRPEVVQVKCATFGTDGKTNPLLAAPVIYLQCSLILALGVLDV